MDAETCPSSATSAADSGAVGGYLPHDLLHDPDESAGGAVLKMLVTAFVVFVLPYIAIAAIAKISLITDDLKDFVIDRK